jgi:DNA-binding response OmpR family regulator
MRILLVEDAMEVSDAVATCFTRRGDAVDHAATVAGAYDLIAVQDYDVAILDIELPDGNGFDVLNAIRETRKSTLILMLTARANVNDRVSALDLGADDYLVKPFDLRELQARVRALLRRSQDNRSSIIEFGDLVFDPAHCALNIHGSPVTLTRREFCLLEIMLANRGRVIPKERIFDRMFSFNEEEVALNAVETHVARLRRKLEGSCVSIRTLRGLGYQLVAEG